MNIGSYVSDSNQLFIKKNVKLQYENEKGEPVDIQRLENEKEIMSLNATTDLTNTTISTSNENASIPSIVNKTPIIAVPIKGGNTPLHEFVSNLANSDYTSTNNSQGSLPTTENDSSISVNSTPTNIDEILNSMRTTITELNGSQEHVATNTFQNDNGDTPLHHLVNAIVFPNKYVYSGKTIAENNIDDIKRDLDDDDKTIIGIYKQLSHYSTGSTAIPNNETDSQPPAQTESNQSIGTTINLYTPGPGSDSGSASDVQNNANKKIDSTNVIEPAAHFLFQFNNISNKKGKKPSDIIDDQIEKLEELKTVIASSPIPESSPTATAESKQEVLTKIAALSNHLQSVKGLISSSPDIIPNMEIIIEWKDGKINRIYSDLLKIFEIKHSTMRTMIVDKKYTAFFNNNNNNNVLNEDAIKEINDKVNSEIYIQHLPSDIVFYVYVTVSTNNVDDTTMHHIHSIKYTHKSALAIETDSNQ
jgi:hypothetical protein